MASGTPLSKANTSFALALFKALGDKDRASNVFYSPLSISSALAMVLLGARGNTATQMSECLKTKDITDDVHTSFASLLEAFNKPDVPYSLSVANRLYGEQSYEFDEDFLDGTRKHYKAELDTVDFAKNAENARVNINTWVEKKTEGKIKNLLARGAVDASSRLVLVNAIYFKSHWSVKFEESSTRDGKFRVNKNNTKPVKMMHQESRFPLAYISQANCQVIDLPYKGKELSMLIFLPSDNRGWFHRSTGLKTLEQQLTYENFVEWTRPDKMDVVQVVVELPRFKMEELYDLQDVLTSIGMGNAFNPLKSDFSGMSPAKDLVVSKVVHKAFVEVNEEGTEAAAATAVRLVGKGCWPTKAPKPPARFIADHPFLFFIRHNATNSVLFAGRYCSPE